MLPEAHPLARAVGLAVFLAAVPGGARAGEQPSYAGRDPEEEGKTFRLAPGFRIELAAREPEVADPVSVAWDAKGRMWVAEMPDYPQGTAGGRVRLLEDADRDGRYEKSTVFAEGLPFPTSVLPYRAGVLVSAAPDILYLEDSDGDGRADVRRAVLTGFHAGNTQLRVNGLLYGPDLRIYAANGRSGGKPRRPADPPESAVDIGERDLRFDFNTFKPEAISGPSQFGHAFDAWGRRFLSWNTVHVRQDLLSPRDLERHPRLLRTATVAAISDHGDSARIYPLVPPPRTFNNEPTDHFNASCGLTVERGGLFPPDYAGNVFVCEPLTSLVHRDRLEPGPGPASVARRGEEEKEFLASTDPWFHPVNLRSGPDGGLYVVDFYREMVEHPDYVPRELRGGVDFARGRGHGRIWRILPADKKPLAVDDLSGLPAAELVRKLESPNGQARETARRLLLEKHGPEALGPLSRLALEGEPAARVNALWALHNLRALDLETLLPALRAAEPRLREAALRVVRERPDSLDQLWRTLLRLAGDPDPGVRLQAVLALGDVRGAERDGEIVGALARAGRRDAGDPWSRAALASSLAGREAAFLKALCGGEPRPDERGLAGIAGEAAELAGGAVDAATEAQLLELAAATFERGPATALRLAEGLAQGLFRSKRAARDELAAIPRPASAPLWDAVFARAAEAAGAAGLERAVRTAAIALLAHAPWGRAGPVLKGLLDPRLDLGLEVAAVRALGRQDAEEVAALLLAAWPRATPQVRSAVLDALLSSPGRRRALAEALLGGTVAPRELDPGRREALLKALGTEDRERLAAVFRPRETDRGSVIARYRPVAATGGDAARGAEIFRATCATCHRFAGGGHQVGPDLSGISRKSREELLVALLDPNRAVVPGYTAYTVATETGQLLTGLLASETDRAITLRKGDGLEDAVPRAAIRSISSTGLSLMPEGLETSLGPEDVASLLRYLEVGEARPR